MATALKLDHPASASISAKHARQWQAIVDAVTPLYNRHHQGREYYSGLDVAIRKALGSISIRDAASLYEHMFAEYNGEPSPFVDDSLEDHACYIGLESCVWLIANGNALNKSEALARVAFFADKLDGDPDGPIERAGAIAAAIKSMGKDIAAKPREIFCELKDPAFNPLRDAAARIKFLDGNDDAFNRIDDTTVGVGHDLHAAIYDEKEALFKQASFMEAYTADDALMLLGAIDFAVHPLINNAQGALEQEPEANQLANQFLLDMGNSILRSVYRLANWLESTHAIERRSLAGQDLIPHRLSPFEETAALVRACSEKQRAAG